LVQATAPCLLSHPLLLLLLLLDMYLLHATILSSSRSSSSICAYIPHFLLPLFLLLSCR
jgi:hypothetical protein